MASSISWIGYVRYGAARQGLSAISRDVAGVRVYRVFIDSQYFPSNNLDAVWRRIIVMAEFGNHLKMHLPHGLRDRAREFYAGVLGCKDVGGATLSRRGSLRV